MLRFRYCLITAFLGTAVLLSFPLVAADYSNTAGVVELWMGARPLAMGGAFVGLADDANALFFNAAGLGQMRGFAALSSAGVRPALGSLGDVTLTVPLVGVGLRYFDFGDVPEVDEYGNVIGSFSYRNYVLVAGAGMAGSSVPFMRRLPVLGNLSVGAKIKYIIVSTLDPGSGSGLALDLGFMYDYGVHRPVSRSRYAFRLGIVVENLLGLPLRYGSGHQEGWERAAVIGASLTFLNSLTIVADVAPNRGVRLGCEWNALNAIAVRAGIRVEDVVMWSLGTGVRFGMLSLDYALAIHPHLAAEHRLSFMVRL